MKYLRPLLCLIAFPTLVFAQSNYKAGYVVNTKGDTVKGFIDVREWDFNPKIINFKAEASGGQVMKFGPADVKYAEVSGFFALKSYSGIITNDSTVPDQVAGDEAAPDTSTRLAAIFLKVVDRGDKVALYSFKDEFKIHYFIGAAPDFAVHELIYRRSRLTEENTFRRQLGELALKFNEADDNTIVRIGRAQYSDDDILWVVNKINHISADAYKKKHFAGSSYNFFVGLGMNVNNISTSSGSTFYGSGGRSVTSYRPAVFLGANFFANPATRRLQFRIELSVAQSQFKSLYNSTYYPYGPAEASYSQLDFAATPMIIFNFYNAENLKIFGGAGLSLIYYKYSNSYLGSQNHDNSGANLTANEPYLFNSFDDTFLFRAGAQIGKHVIIFADYQTAVYGIGNGYYGLSSTCEHLGVNYLFK